jgi:predicted dehydrogenase
MSQKLRIGIIGAGANTKSKHIPELLKQPNVEVVAVSNRTIESAQKVAQEFKIPHVYADWKSITDSPNIDAVVIGTWPNTHAEISCAALAGNKHVLCEARMASNLQEAQRMLDAASSNPNLIAQIVPSPFGLIHNDFLIRSIENQLIGDLREYVVIGADDTFYDFSQIIHWRQDASISGQNILAMGILHETVSRWIPPVKQVFAQTSIFEKHRHDPDSPNKADVTVPDSVQIITRLENGAAGLYHISGIEQFGPGKQIHLFGSKGTIKIFFNAEGEQIYMGRIGFDDLKLLNVESNKLGRWRVEEEFINAIRGTEKVKLNNFSTAYEYMKFTDAVHRSARENKPVQL